MALTEAQQVTLRADIEADSALNQLPHTTSSADEICAAYNTEADPPFWVYRVSLSKHQIVAETSQDGTIFTWAGNGFIGRSPGELTAWQELFGGSGPGGPGSGAGGVNPSLPNVRQAFQDIFSGTGNAAQNRTHIAAVWRRLATRLEHLFAGEPGVGTPANPATMTVVGPLTLSEADTVWSN